MSTSTSTLEAPKTATSPTPAEPLWWSRGTGTWRELRGASHLVSLLPTADNSDGEYLAVRRGPRHPDRYVQIAPLPGAVGRWAVEVGGGTGGLARQAYDATSGSLSSTITSLPGIVRQPSNAPAHVYDAGAFQMAAQQVIELTVAWVRRGQLPKWAATVAAP